VLPFAAIGLAAGPAGCAPPESDAVSRPASRLTVYAASSLTDALRTVADAYRPEGSVELQVSFGASGMLARQIANGAPADIFLSANTSWVDWLAERELCEPGTRQVILRNSLVVVAPRGGGHGITQLAELAELPRVALANTRIAPAGIYARQALENSGLWASLQGKIVEAETARATLSLVERGEADAGIVYATDARASELVEVVLAIPDRLHEPVAFTAVAIRSSHGDAPKRHFMRFLRSGKASTVFKNLGFEVVR
jgi:molybdate transport system substrate-binding protein